MNSICWRLLFDTPTKTDISSYIVLQKWSLPESEVVMFAFSNLIPQWNWSSNTIHSLISGATSIRDFRDVLGMSMEWDTHCSAFSFGRDVYLPKQPHFDTIFPIWWIAVMPFKIMLQLSIAILIGGVNWSLFTRDLEPITSPRANCRFLRPNELL